MPLGSVMTKLHACSRCSIATARKRASSAARCAIRCCGSGRREHPGELGDALESEMLTMPLLEDRIKVGRCYRMTIRGKPIVAKVIRIYPLDIGVDSNLNGLRERKKNPMKESVVRWAWRDAARSGIWRQAPGWLLPAFAFATEAEVACDDSNVIVLEGSN